MNTLKKYAALIFLFAIMFQTVRAQEETEQTRLQQVLTQKGFNKTAPSIVKLVSDEGKNIGAGVIVGMHKDGAGFILTSYSMVAGRDKVAVILKDYPEPLLGHVVDRWIDFDTDLAIVAVKNFPITQRTINMGKAKSAHIGDTITLIGHIEDSDWLPVPIKITDSLERHFIFDARDYSGIEGAPILSENGNMIGLIVSNDFETTEEDNLTLAVKSSEIKPILNEWFKPITLEKKWREQGGGIATWLWAVGGSVLGGTVATTIVLIGGNESPKGLPRPPETPDKQ